MTPFIEACWEKVSAWAMSDGTCLFEQQIALRKQVTKMFQDYEEKVQSLTELRVATAQNRTDDVSRLLLEAERAISENHKSLLAAKEHELQTVREVLGEDLKTANARVLTLEVENQRVKRELYQLRLQLRTYVQHWRADGARSNDPKSPSWPIECANEIEELLDEASLDT